MSVRAPERASGCIDPSESFAFSGVEGYARARHTNQPPPDLSFERLDSREFSALKCFRLRPGSGSHGRGRSGLAEHSVVCSFVSFRRG